MVIFELCHHLQTFTDDNAKYLTVKMKVNVKEEKKTGLVPSVCICRIYTGDLDLRIFVSGNIRLNKSEHLRTQ